MANRKQARYTREFEQIGLSDVPLVGGKNASLGEMIRELSSRGIRIPKGFAITSEAYWLMFGRGRLKEAIGEILSGLRVSDVEDLSRRGLKIRERILACTLPAELRDDILAAYRSLGGGRTEALAVAVRSSATAEDLPEASFAGQQETFLNVQGEEQLLDACRRCYASLFTDRAISYREYHGFDHFKVALSIGVQKMVRSDLAAAGVMFSVDTETGFRDVVLINASYGLGENIVQGSVNPDEFLVFKKTLGEGYRPILRKTLGSKEFRLVCEEGGTRAVRNEPVPTGDRDRFSLGDDEILQLARWACEIEAHYSSRAGRWVPMDIEWAKDGKSGELFILQARPETVQASKNFNEVIQYRIEGNPTEITHGQSVGDKIRHGLARVILNAHDLSQLKEGEVLVTDRTDPDWEPAMKHAAAIVTNRGGRTCHAAIVSREFGIPAVVGSENGTSVIRDGQVVTVSCAEGETGHVYEGRAHYFTDTLRLDRLPRTETKLMMNVANPESAFKLSFLPNDGIGLARIEFIINSRIGAHPMALACYGAATPPDLRIALDRLARGYSGKAEFFVEKLAEGVGMIAAAFHPKDVIVRLSDFKSNEYAGLLGGRAYEPQEENPMLGFRGASRYYHPAYRAGFALECRAMRRVREEMGLTNLKIMVPFCRTVEEGRLVIAEMARNGLRRGENGLEVYVMCEIPSNVLLADEFSDVFDGFSIGSNDLTQLILGVDRDSQIVAPLFDERNPAVKKMIAEVIRKARARGRKIGICGQAPSDYPEFARFLVEQGIDSISLNPDAVVKTLLLIERVERERQERKEGHEDVFDSPTP